MNIAYTYQIILDFNLEYSILGHWSFNWNYDTDEWKRTIITYNQWESVTNGCLQIAEFEEEENSMN